MRLKNGTSLLSQLNMCEETVDPHREAEAIKQCLHYLSGEAVKLDLVFTAYLIDVAADSLEPGTGKGDA